MAIQPTERVLRIMAELERLMIEQNLTFPLSEENAQKLMIRASYNTGYNDAFNEMLGYVPDKESN